MWYVPKKKAGIPVGEGFVGRVINALGEPIDGKGAVEEDDYYPVEREAPGIIEQKICQCSYGDRYLVYRLHVPDRTWTA